jgi:translation initiation factor 3 subunit I
VEASKAATTGGQGKFEAVFYHQVYACHVGGEQLNKGHFGPINVLAFNPSGRSFASGGEDGNVRMNHFDESYFSFKLNE